MKHLAVIQSEFLKEARDWEEMSYEEQKEYLKKHRKSKKKITAKPKSKTTGVKKKLEEKRKNIKPLVNKQLKFNGDSFVYQDIPKTKTSNINGVSVKYHSNTDVINGEKIYVTGLKRKDLQKFIGENNSEIDEWGREWAIDLGDHTVSLHGYDGNSWIVQFTGDKKSFESTMKKAFPNVNLKDDVNNAYDAVQDYYESDSFDEIQDFLDDIDEDDSKSKKKLKKLLKDAAKEEDEDDDD